MYAGALLKVARIVVSPVDAEVQKTRYVPGWPNFRLKLTMSPVMGSDLACASDKRHPF
jgi:hypothetical protein